jgi:hypothetical protein
VPRKLLLVAALLAVLVAAPSAPAQTQVLLPGVTYQKQVQFTLNGPVVVHVVTGPRPGGLYSLQPALSNESIAGTERLTDLEKRLAPTATVAGLSGDRFTPDGRPIGVLMRGGALDYAPLPSRSSIGIDSSGLLHVDRVALVADVQGSGQRRTFNYVNEPAPANGFALFTPAWGPATPPTPGSVEFVLQPFPPAAPNTSLQTRVTAIASNGATPIPAGGAVLVARGTAALKFQPEAPVGQLVIVRLVLRPSWAGMVGALGGGPVLVRNGKAVPSAAEEFTSDYLGLPQARAAVGQLADGRVVLVAADGGQPGYSTGMTNFDLARAMVRLGAVTAAALGAGPQVGLAFDGSLLSRPSGSELPLSDALLLSYAGVYAPPPTEPVLSPNGDNVGEVETLADKVVRPSTVSAQLVGPGASLTVFSGQQQPGTYPFSWNGTAPDGTRYPEGRWRFVVSATDDLGRASSVERDFSLNLTLGYPKTAGGVLSVPRAKPRVVAFFTLAHPATVTSRIETRSGVVLKTLARKSYEPGTVQVAWDGVTRSGAVVYSGQYVARVIATNTLGTVSLSAGFTVRRVTAARRR